MGCKKSRVWKITLIVFSLWIVDRKFSKQKSTATQKQLQVDGGWKREAEIVKISPKLTARRMNGWNSKMDGLQSSCLNIENTKILLNSCL